MIWEKEKISHPIKTSLSGANPLEQVAQANMNIARARVVWFFFLLFL